MISAPRLELSGLSKAFFGVPAVRDVSFRIGAGQILALVGQNGAGKSTLMNLVGGVLRPDAGHMTIDGTPYQPVGPRDATQRGIAFIHQELNLFTNLTIAENIVVDGFPLRRFGPIRLIDRGPMLDRARVLLKEVDLDLPPDTAIEHLSPGERQLVEVAKALHLDARLIIFDEPTTSLTARETERLFALIRRLRERGTAIIFISHVLGDVLRLADEIAVLRDGSLVATGPRTDFDVTRMITLMIGRAIENLYPEHVNHARPDALLTARGLSARGLVRDINLALRRGEIVGLFGLMGSGRTELARIIFGLEEYDAGDVVVGTDVLARLDPRSSIRSGIAFVTENRREEGLLMNVSIAENIGLVALPRFAATPLQFIAWERLGAATAALSAALQIKARSAAQPVKSLSGGNQQKVVIAKWLMSEPSIFIMDEPTRGVDVGAKHEIYTIMERLAADGVGILFISSEIEELLAMADRIVVMSRGEIVAEFERADFDKERILRAAFREGVAAA
jgi:ABC-type sugar transport system ATPase subunit